MVYIPLQLLPAFRDVSDECANGHFHNTCQVNFNSRISKFVTGLISYMCHESILAGSVIL
jgi:hypothetical protein